MTTVTASARHPHAIDAALAHQRPSRSAPATDRRGTRSFATLGGRAVGSCALGFAVARRRSAIAARDDAQPSAVVRLRHRPAGESLWQLARTSPRQPTRATSSPRSSDLNQLDGADGQPGQRLAIPAEYATSTDAGPPGRRRPRGRPAPSRPPRPALVES